MRILASRRIAGAHAGTQRLFSGIGYEHHLALQHVDEFVLERMPVAHRRLAARSEGDQVDAEVLHPARRGKAPLRAIAHTRLEWFWITGAAFFFDGIWIKAGQLQGRHLSFSKASR